MSTSAKVCTIIGSDKGGVGKSMIATFVTLVFDRAGLPLSLIEIDNARKLSGVIGKDRVLSLSAAPDLKEVTRSRHVAESYYNPAYLRWAQGDSLTDLGANVTTSLLAWFRQCDIGELAAEDDIRFRFVACASPDEQAIQSAVDAIEEARETLGQGAEYFVVLNDLGGAAGFDPYHGHPAFLRLAALVNEGSASILEVRYCDSGLLDYGKGRGLTPLETIRQYEEIALFAGYDDVMARVQKKRLQRWLQDVQESLTPLLTVEEFDHVPVRASAPGALRA